MVIFFGFAIFVNRIIIVYESYSVQLVNKLSRLVLSYSPPKTIRTDFTFKPFGRFNVFYFSFLSKV